MKMHSGKFRRWSILENSDHQGRCHRQRTIEHWKKPEIRQSFALYLDLHRIETNTFLGQKNVNKDWALKYAEGLLIVLIVRTLFWLYKKMLSSKSLQAINAGEGVEKSEPSYTVGGNAN